ncbi:RrF2 family transcriptional regulator [Tannockella kyphosi]|uniref:RrF2 family transcriptional regulator n=1 Tax=Tannockella kyphosi TaxID=2899121 RepID=UPI00201234F1|nr:Rrf2 family transcriptional regulator [Tannockella kyphosi]
MSTRGRYALRFMIHLANHREDKSVSLKDVADKEEISLKYLEHIVTKLTKAKMVVSRRGVKGGYSLIKPAEDYLITEILEVVEGDLSPVKLEDLHHDAELESFDLWQGLRDVIYDYLDSFTLEDLANEKK